MVAEVSGLVPKFLTVTVTGWRSYRRNRRNRRSNAGNACIVCRGIVNSKIIESKTFVSARHYLNQKQCAVLRLLVRPDR